MSKNTKIEWCHHTFNPWIGCTKIGPGCDHCYAESWAKRSGLVRWGATAERRRTSAENWKKPLQWNAEAERLGIRYRVFCASLADVFDNVVPVQWRRDLFDLIAATPSLDWLLLTKRIGNARSLYGEAYLDSAHAWPSNVWIGATVCNQEEADRDIPKLLAVPARVRFLSIEPMLGPIHLDEFHPTREPALPKLIDGIDWVIVGGESGPGARPMHPDWARSLRDQCATAGVPFLFKQWGEWAPGENAPRAPTKTQKVATLYDDRWSFGSVTVRQSEEMHRDDEPDVWRLGKKAAGRQLDGVLHDAFPEAKP